MTAPPPQPTLMHDPTPDTPAGRASSAAGQAPASAANQGTTAPPPASGFRLVRYFSVASLAAFVLVAATLLYFQLREGDSLKQVQQEQSAFFAQMQDSFVQRHDAAAPAYLLRVYEAGNVNLTRLFANALWDKDFAPFVAKAQRVPVDQCRAVADIKDAGGKTVPPREKQTCFAEVGKKIMAFPEFESLDAKVFDLVKKSTVFKIKVFDLRGITVYSSEHNQIGEDKLGNTAWESAMAGKPASQLTSRDKFSAFEGELANRDLISSYVPVRVPGSERIVAVFEVYSDVTQFLAQIMSTSSEIRELSAAKRAQMERAAAANHAKVDANTNLLHAIVLGLLTLLYLALLLVVRHGQRIIDKHGFERKRAELALSRQKDLYAVLSQSNKAIVRLADREELFAAVCRIAVEHGRFRFAWIGLIDNDDQRLKPVARYGEDAGYIDQLNLSGDSASASRRSLIGRIPRSGTYVISNDFLNDPAMAPWHEAARRAGVRASAEFPIRQGGAVVGAINLYAGEPGFFTEELAATLEEMANDVSFALDNFEREAERERVVEALRESEEKLRAIFEGVVDGILVVDAEARKFLIGNSAICRMLGYTPEEIVRLGIPDIHPERDLPHVIEQFEKQLHGESQISTDIPVKRKDGSVFYADVKSAPVRLGGKDGLLGIFRDITERKRTQESLHAAEEQFRGLVEQSIAGIYIIQDGTFAYVNPRCAEIYGCASADELLGRDPLSLVAEKDRNAVAENIRRRLEGETQSISYGFTALRKDGSTVEIGVHGARATYRGRPAIIGLMQDISEKKRAEEQIQRYVVQLENTFMRAVEIATTLSEMRDPYTAGHERRVAEIAVAIGSELGFEPRRQEGLRVAGYLHDIGKITVPTEILAKPGKLSPLEFELIKGHSQASYDVLKNVEFPWPVAEIALQHHERLDGSGYPRGLKGEAILLEARIMAVADVIEAMSSHRPYRPGLGIEKALAEIERGRGTVYDATVADACLKLFREKGYAIPA
ncbi:MAG: PAS domain S-box protein [Betaproteobacteria bacterium]|nr:PAS domain S-box protein [Betaproteobacteria bacterium]